jgi:hypothetical protein
MNTLSEVKSYMEWWGWTHGGEPGSVKRDASGEVTARHGDAQWIADVEKACATLERLRERLRVAAGGMQ